MTDRHDEFTDVGLEETSPGPPSSSFEASDVDSAEEVVADREAAVVEHAAEQEEPEIEVDALRRERDDLRTMVQRIQADFENFRKRTMRDQAAQHERAIEALVEQLLPVLDSFELAVLSIPEGELDDASQKLRKGVELVYAELLGTLERAGLERVDALGKPFDPEVHEAVMREGDGEVVTEVMRTGYRLKGRVLRPAMVKVGG